MTTNRPLRVFLCHSSADKPAVRELYQKLRAEPWIQPWLDEEELYPGQDWNMEIEKTVEAADAIIVCLTNNSITKEGYIQKEIKTALDYSDYKPEGAVFIIPVRLEECKPPNRLSKWQYADYFEGQRERGFQRLLVSLRKRADSLDLRTVAVTPQKEINFDLPTEISTITVKNIQFMRVQASRFIMGSDINEEVEKPQHIVDIPYEYWMAQTPVTNEQYNIYLQDRGFSHPVIKWELKKDHPVINVNWAEAIDYCNWLNDLLKDDPPFGLTFRLPSEAEWEKAARSVDGRQYPWGNTFDKNKCNSGESDFGGTSSVRLYSPQGDSPYGCTDMLGNVWEWTCSFFNPYPYDSNTSTTKRKGSYGLVLRGGSWFDHQSSLRNSIRGYLSVQRNVCLDFGFRICLAPPLPK